MSGFVDLLLENSCGEANPVLDLISQIDSASQLASDDDYTVADRLRSHKEVAGAVNNAREATKDVDDLLESEVAPEVSADAQHDVAGDGHSALAPPGGKIFDGDSRQNEKVLPTEEFHTDNAADAQNPTESEMQSFESFFLLDPANFLNPGLFVNHPLTSERFIGALADNLPAENEEAHGHADDCTPTSGPDYLMEIQNPNWEAALHSRLVNTVHSIRHRTSESTFFLDEFTRFAENSLADVHQTYPFYNPLKSTETDDFAKATELMNSGKVVEAIPFLEYAARAHPEGQQVWTLLALANYLSQNDVSAVAACKQYLSQGDPKDRSRNMILLLLATCLLDEGDSAACEAVVFQWMVGHLSLNDDILEGMLRSKENLLHDDSPRSMTHLCLEICGMYASDMAGDGTLHWAMAVLNFGLGLYATAGRHFEHVLKQNPKSPSVLNQIGACLHNLQKYDQALELQDQALALCPGFPRALFNKAMTLASLDQADPGLALLKEAMTRQQSAGVDISDQFWYLAARIATKLPGKEPAQYDRRSRVLSSILARDLSGYSQQFQ